MFAEAPKDPAAMILSLLRDDLKKLLCRGIVMMAKKQVSVRSLGDGTASGEEFQKRTDSADPGAFRLFYEEYQRRTAESPIVYSDLSIMITADGLGDPDHYCCDDESSDRASTSELRADDLTVIPQESHQNEEVCPKPQYKGRSLNQKADWNSLSVAGKELKETQPASASGNLPRSKR